MRSSLAGIVCFACCVAAQAQSLSIADFGETGPHRVLGNGNLTAAVARDGGVIALRWPGPVSPNHLGDNTGALPVGACWGYQTNGELRWLTGSGWQPVQQYVDSTSPIVRTTGLTDDGVKFTQECWVMPDQDVLVNHVEVSGLAATSRVGWYADFSPQLDRLPSWPLVLSEPAGMKDFAAFFDSSAGVMYHFRPAEPTAKDWELLDTAFAAPTEFDWSQFADGVWIAYTTTADIKRAACGLRNEAETAARESSGAQRAIGDADSAILLAPSETGAVRTAAIWVAAGNSKDAVDGLLDSVLQTDIAQLREEVVAEWRAWLDGHAVPAPELSEPYRRALHTMHALRSPSAFAMARTAAGPMSGVDVPRWSMWMNRAWHEAGDESFARNHLQFIAGTAQLAPQPHVPAGLIPAGLDAHGNAAAPSYVVDLDGVSSFVGASSAVIARSDPGIQDALFEDLWPALDAATGLLVRWSVERTLLPLPAFDYQLRRDAQHLTRLPAYYAAVDAATNIALERNLEQPEWTRRRSELEALIRQHCIENDQWRFPATSLPADGGFFRPGTPAAEQLCRALLESAGDADAIVGLHALLNVTRLGQGAYDSAVAASLAAIVAHEDSAIEYDGVAAALAVLVMEALGNSADPLGGE